MNSLFPNNYFSTDDNYTRTILYFTRYALAEEPKVSEGKKKTWPDHAVNFTVFSIESISFLFPNNYFSTDNIQERFYIFRSFAPVMARSPIPKEPPTMDLTLTLVSELSIHAKNQLSLADLKIDIPICIKKRRGTPELYNNYNYTVEKIHSFL